MSENTPLALIMGPDGHWFSDDHLAAGIELLGNGVTVWCNDYVVIARTSSRISRENRKSLKANGWDARKHPRDGREMWIWSEGRKKED